MIDFVGRRRYFAVFSLFFLVPCLVALAIWQLNPGIDFDGGLELEVRFLAETEPAPVLDALAEAGFEDASVTPTDDGTFLVARDIPEADRGLSVQDDLAAALEEGIGPVQTVDSTLSDEAVELDLWFPADVSQDAVRDAARSIDAPDARIQATGESSFKIRAEEPSDSNLDRLRADLETALENEIGPFFVLSSAGVSGILSAEIAQDASIALVIAAVAILIYISLAFRRLPNPALYGAAAIVALLHDITIVVGAFSIFGQVFDTEINAMFVTALLAIIGYSVNDTIVIFDRIRENRLGNPREPFRASVNAAVTQSLGRSLNTSLTLIFALVALFVIGGVTVRPFVLVLLIGAIAGTYSSIGVASQILVLWHEHSIHRLLRLDRGAPERRTRASA